jgi:hypothetical protein
MRRRRTGNKWNRKRVQKSTFLKRQRELTAMSLCGEAEHHSKIKTNCTRHILEHCNTPEDDGMLKEAETATLRKENAVSTARVKLRGVIEDVVETVAVMAALVIPVAAIRGHRLGN